MRSIPRLSRGFYCALVVSALLLSGTSSFAQEETKPKEEKNVRRVESSTPARRDEQPRFASNRTRADAGQSRMIPFQTQAAVQEDRIFPCKITPEGAVTVLQAPLLLAGQTTGFLRVRPEQIGEVLIQIGDARLLLEVGSEPGPGEWQRPQWISPAEGAVFWGQIQIAAEGWPGMREDLIKEVRFINRDGRSWPARRAEVLQKKDAPGLDPRWVADLDAAQCGEGALELTVEFVTQDGTKLASRTRQISAYPSAELLLADEAEQLLSAAEQRWAVEKEGNPDARAPRFAKAEEKEGASGGSDVLFAGGNSEIPMLIEIREAGHYQLMVNATGQPGGGTLPSVGFQVFGEDNTRTASRLASGTAQRLSVGTPMKLEVGTHHLTVRYTNDFNNNGQDRNLMLDRVELAKVSDTSVGAGSGLVAESIFDGLSIASPMEVNVRTRGLDRNKPVALVINDIEVAHQHANRPTFDIWPNVLAPGSNTIVFRGYAADGSKLESPPQFLRRWMDGPVESRLPQRFSVTAPGWDPGMNQRLVREEKRPPVEATFYANGETLLTLPESLEGRYLVQLHARGEEFEGAPEMSVDVRAGEETQKLGTTPISKRLNFYRVGEFDFKAGDKQLVLAFTNDLAVKDKGDRNLWLRGVRLVPVNAGEVAGPSVRVIWPRRSVTFGPVGAVVAEMHAPQSSTLEFRVNGESRGVLLPGPEDCNPQVFLFSTEGLAPGRHTGSVVAKDSEGREVSGRTVEFVVDPTPKRDACARALTLLRRLGFGPDPLELADLLILGENGWLESRLGNTLPGSETVNALTAIRMDNPNNAGTMVRIVLESAIASRNPVRSRFVFWAQNHFNTWHRKIGARPKWEEHLAFEKAGIARFPELLRISATSPAMLAYLDQNRSLRNRINENYAREILELHTVGVHGGYTQTDVTALAHLLTGWSFSEEAPDRGTGNFEEARFRFIAVSNSPEKQRVFGMEFPEQKTPDYDRISSLLEMLASHPATAQFIAKKLAAAYVSDPAPQALVRAMAVAYMESNGSMGATMAAMARHSEFWAEAEKPRLRHPLEHGIGIARQLQRLDTGRIQEYLDRSGAGLFDRATPDGYPTVDTSYLGSNAMLQRWKLAGDAAPQLLRVAGGPPKEGETPEAFIARLALVSNGRLPSPTSRAALMELLDKKNFTENSNPPLAAAELMLRLPESQLR